MYLLLMSQICVLVGVCCRFMLFWWKHTWSGTNYFRLLEWYLQFYSCHSYIQYKLSYRQG